MAELANNTSDAGTGLLGVAPRISIIRCMCDSGWNHMVRWAIDALPSLIIVQVTTRKAVKPGRTSGCHAEAVALHRFRRTSEHRLCVDRR